jgi:AICAR transformylase/IMP cyclohydrolase PurH
MANKSPNDSDSHSGRQQQQDASESAAMARDDSLRRVIQLDDRTVGPEVEINRLKSKLITVLEEISQLRKEHVKLVSDQQKLKSELTELKLALAAIEANELR